MRRNLRNKLIVQSIAFLPSVATAVTPPPGYIYDTQLLSNLTQSCIAAGPGGTFVGIGPGFTANAQAVVLAKESGELRVVALGFNSIGDCAYDAANDILYVNDNADNTDLDITTGFAGNTGAQTGDTVFAIPSAATASGLNASDSELLPADSISSAFSVAADAGGNVFVSDAIGSGSGTVLKITPGPVSNAFAPGFDFTGGLAIDPVSGDIFVAESLASFDNQITRFDSSGTPVGPIPFAGPSFGFGSIDLAFNTDGKLLASGVFGGDVVAFDISTGAPSSFISGFTFASGMTVNPFTKRLEVLSSTFSGADEDKSLHRFTPISQLVPGKGSAKTECVQEFYGLELVGSPAKDAVCVDGAACDADGTVNDACLFPIGFCFKADDDRFSDCDAGNVAEVSITAKPADAAIQKTAAAVQAALPIGAASCFFSDGYYVPVKITGSGAKNDGKGIVKVKSKTDDGAKDSDAVKLICQPAP
jgi:hypothetical protein